MFFTIYRAKYDIAKNKLEPPIEKWQKHCLCQKPLNPDHLVIQCENCNRWYHPNCIKLTDEQAEKMENFKCTECILATQK